jgi:site-specific recombinase XerD
MLIAEGLPVNVVSEMLGHTLTSTTIDIYSHVMPAAHRHAAEAMERLLR